MKKDCKYCGHKDNEIYLIEDCDIDRHLYDWYAFECEGCGYKCSFSIENDGLANMTKMKPIIPWKKKRRRTIE